ncbi:restriction endonuclease subunit S [Candidatus Francisella endociliophora]|uniref:restriction endonuclease subunit S n=1 Tax=Candidatus Francisella endociliophora TaxID=653937 RepID=UPI000694BFCE|nr:restriction endonuclease subunit S [Francisella sp. FSC1006]
MTEYKLDSSVDNNKVFLVDYSEVFGKRLNPQAYRNIFNFDKVNSVKLKKIAYIDPITSFSSLKKSEKITFIPMDAVSDKNGIVFKNYTKEVSESKGYTRFKQGDLIWAKITPCMQNGKSAVVEKTLNGYACGSTEFFVIRAKANDINIKYLHFLLRHKSVLAEAQNYFGGSAGHQRVSKDFLENFDVPLLPIEIQKQIVKKYEQAYQQKQQKEQKAKELLASIDSYLLDKLGIELPEKDNSLQARIFTTDFSDVSGSRWDCDYNNKYFNEIENIVLKSSKNKYEMCALTNIADDIFQGVGRNLIDDSKNILLKVKNIRFDNNIDYENVENLNIDSEVKKLKKGDIISPFIGEAVRLYKFAVFENEAVDNNYFVDNNTGVIRLGSKANPFYIQALLSSALGRILIDKLIGGGGVPFIGSSNMKNIKIPLPPLTPAQAKDGEISQQEIVEHISAIRAEAKQLQEEAIADLETTKAEIEKMILG